MNEKINLTLANGSVINADIICYIENITNNKRYLYYTLNETSGSGTNTTVKIYVAKIKQNNPALDSAISEEDWGLLKGYMGDALKGTANPNIKYLPISELGNPISVSERAIAMPTSYDYINKQRGIYATAVASMSQPTVTPAEAPTTLNNNPVPPVASEPVTAPTPTPSPTPATTPNPLEAVMPEPPAPSPAPTITPNPLEAVMPEPPAPSPAPTTTPNPLEAVMPEPPAPSPTPAITPVSSVMPTSNDVSPSPALIEPNLSVSNGNDKASSLQPIDLSTIEEKYKEMLATLENLKKQEIEAAKRYNATIELSQLHNEQHATYVQNEQLKENVQVPSAPIPVASPQPNPAAPASPVTQAPIAEPTPITPTPIAPAPVTDQQLETNWFDMPTD